VFFAKKFGFLASQSSPPFFKAGMIYLMWFNQTVEALSGSVLKGVDS
jgi:hypothetical protein